MLPSILIALVASFTLSQATPARVRRQADYCDRHVGMYSRFCGSGPVEISRDQFAKLAKFCPLYEKVCGVRKAPAFSEANELPEDLVLPPPLPKGGDFKFDLPIASQGKTRFHTDSDKSPAPAMTELTPEMVATCTPDCTAAHCTTACKCAYTHPKVHSMCNPPASAELAQTCTRWYGKCTMFQQISYDK